MRFALLVVMVASSSIFVGNYLYLATRAQITLANVFPPWRWLVLPPLVVLGTAAVLTILAPLALQRRYRWGPVPPDRGGAALSRYRGLIAEAGLAAEPVMMWNPGDTSSRALAYGLPGRYRVAVAPALLGAARRRPATFDAVLQHELAHVRHRDVALAYYAVIVWYVLAGLLVLPLIAMAVGRDFSSFGEYVTRVALLAILVYWIRAAVLRAREHYADVAACSDPTTRQALCDAVATQPDQPRLRRLFSLHPSATSRIRMVTDPDSLGRLDAVEMFAVGLSATWAEPLLVQLLFSLGMSATDAPRAARMLVLGMVGAYVGTVLARWAGCRAPRHGLARAAAGLALGLSLGVVVSVGRTGLFESAGEELPAMTLSAVITAAYLLWAADFAQAVIDPGAPGPTRGRVALCVLASTSMVLALTGAVFPIIELVSLVGSELVWLTLRADPISALSTSAFPTVLAILAVLWGAVVLASRRRRAVSTAAVAALSLGLGLFGVLLIAVLRSKVDLSGDPNRIWRYDLAAVWIAVAAATLAAVALAAGRTAGRLVIALMTAVLVTVVIAFGFAASDKTSHGVSLGLPEIIKFAQASSALTLLLAPLAAGLIWLSCNVAPQQLQWPLGLRIGAAVAALAIFTVMVIALVPGYVTGPPIPDLPLWDDWN